MQDSIEANKMLSEIALWPGGMFYVKKKIGHFTFNIDIKNDNIFAKCIHCGSEISIGFNDITNYDKVKSGRLFVCNRCDILRRKARGSQEKDSNKRSMCMLKENEFIISFRHRKRRLNKFTCGFKLYLRKIKSKIKGDVYH